MAISYRLMACNGLVRTANSIIPRLSVRGLACGSLWPELQVAQPPGSQAWLLDVPQSPTHAPSFGRSSTQKRRVMSH